GRSAAREAAAARCRCAISSFTTVARAGCACRAVAPMLWVVIVVGRAMAGDCAEIGADIVGAEAACATIGAGAIVGVIACVAGISIRAMLRSSAATMVGAP